MNILKRFPKQSKTVIMSLLISYSAVDTNLLPFVGSASKEGAENALSTEELESIMLPEEFKQSLIEMMKDKSTSQETLDTFIDKHKTVILRNQAVLDNSVVNLIALLKIYDEKLAADKASLLKKTYFKRLLQGIVPVALLAVLLRIRSPLSKETLLIVALSGLLIISEELISADVFYHNRYLLIARNTLGDVLEKTMFNRPQP